MADWLFITYSVIFRKASGVIIANSFDWIQFKNYLAWEIWTFSVVTSLSTMRKTVSGWMFLKIVEFLCYICHLLMYSISLFLEELLIWELEVYVSMNMIIGLENNNQKARWKLWQGRSCQLKHGMLVAIEICTRAFYI